MVHEKFDLGLWKSRFPLQKLIDEDKFGRWRNTRADYVTSPGELALELQIREVTQANRGPFPTVPTDVFVFGEGEPREFYLTKVGGQAYLPQGLAWPTTSKGEPMSFVAQLCFLDSTDLVRELPGDVLLIFGRTIQMTESKTLYWEPEDDDSFTFIWTRVDELEKRNTPSDTWLFDPYYAALHRDVDLIDPDPFLKDGSGNLTLLPSILPTTKIGGKPFWAQDEADLPGRFIATLSTLNFKVNTPYPLLNRQEPLPTMKYSSPERAKLISLEAYLHLFLDSDTVYWTAQGS